MFELVELLKQARRDKQVSLKEIGERTKIRTHYLAALENGDFDCFAGEVYLKGALIRYAESVGLNPGEVIALYQRLKSEAGAAADEKEGAGMKGAARKKRLNLRWPAPAAGMVILVIIILIAAFRFIWRVDRPDSGTTPVENHTGDTEFSREAEPDQPAIPVELILERTSETETVYTVRGAERIELKMLFDGSCWVRLEVDGELLFERSFHRGDEHTVTATGDIWLRLGYPPAAILLFEDSEVEGLGRYRQPHNLMFILESRIEE